MRIVELIPIDGRKSFGSKAKVILHDNGVAELLSYETIVCRICNGKFEKIWNEYSATTMRHINAFRHLYGLSQLTKKQYLEGEC